MKKPYQKSFTKSNTYIQEPRHATEPKPAYTSRTVEDAFRTASRKLEIFMAISAPTELCQRAEKRCCDVAAYLFEHFESEAIRRGPVRW